jgi:ubiquinone/menaquinone biosynthesis C-methylase UbiE
MTRAASALMLVQQLRVAALPAFAVLAGVQLDVFTAVNEGARTVEDLAATLGVHTDKLQALLYALVRAGFCTVDAGRFANTPEAATFLVRGSPQYVGELVQTWPAWWNDVLHTAASIRTGTAQAKVDYARMAPEDLEAHYQSFHPVSVATGRELATRYDFSTAQHLLDVGGGTGGQTMALTEAYPQLRVTIVDLPTVTPITQRFVAAAQARDRIRVVSADVAAQAVEGRFDVAMMNSIIPLLALEVIRQLLQHVSGAMVSGGALYITDAGLLDDTRLAPERAVWANLWLINVFDHGAARTEHERRVWLTEAGFEVIERDVLASGLGVMVARKP